MRINPATWLLSALMIACGGSDTDPSDTQQADVETPDDLGLSECNKNQNKSC